MVCSQGLILLAVPLMLGVGLAETPGRTEPGKDIVPTTGRILCRGSAAAGKSVSIEFFDSSGRQGAADAVTDSTGRFTVKISCSYSNNVNERFVIRLFDVVMGRRIYPYAPATIPRAECCGALGDIEACNKLPMAPAPKGNPAVPQKK